MIFLVALTVNINLVPPPRHGQPGQQLHQLQQSPPGLHWPDAAHPGGESEAEHQSQCQEESRHQPGRCGGPAAPDRSGGVFQEVWQLAETQGQTVNFSLVTDSILRNFNNLTIYVTFHITKYKYRKI